MWPKEEICRLLEECPRVDFERKGEPHIALAQLPLGVFITTNYDDFIIEALMAVGKSPVAEICRWNRSPAVQAERVVLGSAFQPTPADPVVYYVRRRGFLGA